MPARGDRAGRSRPLPDRLTADAAVLQGLRQMPQQDGVGAVEVGQGARDAQNPVVASERETEAVDRLPQ